MFVNYKLYRTLPKLSGNVKWDLIVEKINDEWQVVDFHLRPISKYIPYTLINGDYLLNSPHQLNLKKFYEDTISQFYDNPIDPLLSSDWPMIIPKDYNEEQVRHIKNWDDTYWCGTQRMRTELYGKTHECLIPVWLEKVENQLVIKIISTKDCVGSNGFESVEKEIEIKFEPCELPTTFHEKFSNYLFNYLEYCSITEGNNNIISIDFTNKKCTLKGLEVKSGNIITRNDENITKNLVSRERPLLEQNSIITNTFRDDELIVCQLFNFNIIFNDTDILDDYGSSFISTEVEVDNNIIEHRDFYTNHYNVPRFPINNDDDNDDNDNDNDTNDDDDNEGVRIGERIFSSYDFENSLDYLKDYKITELMHKNKIVQPLCHWSPIDSNILFNVYDGFGNTYLRNDKMQYIKHCIGNIEDPLSTATTERNDIQNWNWLGLWYDSSDFIGDHNLCLDDTNIEFTKLDRYINTLKWDVDDLDEDVYLATTYWNDSNTTDYFSLLSFMCRENEFRINIWLDRKEYYEDEETGEPILIGSSLPNFGTIVCLLDNFYGNLYNESYAKSVYEDESYISFYGSSDHRYDCTKYNDFDNYFYELFSFEDEYVKLLTSDHVKLNDDNTKFEILTIDYIKKDNGTYITFSSNTHITLGQIIKALSSYVSYYKQKYENYENILIKNENESKYYRRYNIENAEKVLNYLNRVKSPEVVYFTDSIVTLPDNALDKTTTELNYYKTSNNNSYVTRYSDNLRPFLCELASNQRTSSPSYISFYKGAEYYDKYGLNNLWLKDFFKIDNDFLNDKENYLGYKKFAYTNITPLYPSVDYDPIRLVVSDLANNELIDDDEKKYNVEINYNSSTGIDYKYYLSYQTDCGELNYFTPLNKFYGNPNNEFIQESHGGTNRVSIKYRDPETWWEEWKWFDVSLITPYPHSFKDSPYKVAIYGNNKENIEDDVINYFLEQLNSQQQSIFSRYGANTLICAEYFKQLYNIYYDFKGISIIDNLNITDIDKFVIIDNPQKTGDEYVAYMYEVYAVLK